MTVVAGWVRTTKRGAQELVMVSDSRLTGGGAHIDSAPKLFLLPRTDCAIGFSGNTLVAYPLLTQISQSINFHDPLRDRAIDYLILRSHVIGLINELFHEYDKYAADIKLPDTEFLLGGYSWFKKRFSVDRIYFHKSKKKFEHVPCSLKSPKSSAAFIGDWGDEAKKRFRREIKNTRPKNLDMEPFKVVRDLLRDATDKDSIGGAPQIVSVSQHMNAKYTAVYWPNKTSNKVYLGGRQMRKFENFDTWILDPVDLTKHHLFYGKGRDRDADAETN